MDESIKNFEKMIKENNIVRMPHHKCALCGCYTFYYFSTKNDKVSAKYSSACDCGWSPERHCELSEPAEWYENLTDEDKEMIA